MGALSNRWGCTMQSPTFHCVWPVLWLLSSCRLCYEVCRVGEVGHSSLVTAGPTAFWVSVCEHLEQEQLKTSYLLAPKLWDLLEMFHTKSCETAWARQEHKDSSGASASSLKKSDRPLCIYRVWAVIRRINCWLHVGADWPWGWQEGKTEFSIVCEGSWCNSCGRGLIRAQSFGAA